jgi:hypothetical protein
MFAAALATTLDLVPVVETAVAEPIKEAVSVSLTDNIWHNVVIVRHDNVYSTYLDGEPVDDIADVDLVQNKNSFSLMVRNKEAVRFYGKNEPPITMTEPFYVVNVENDLFAGKDDFTFEFYVYPKEKDNLDPSRRSPLLVDEMKITSGKV